MNEEYYRGLWEALSPDEQTAHGTFGQFLSTQSSGSGLSKGIMNLLGGGGEGGESKGIMSFFGGGEEGNILSKFTSPSKDMYSKFAGKLLGEGEGTLGKLLGGQKGVTDITSMGTGLLKGIVDDDQATTYTAGEVGADVLDIGVGIATGNPFKAIKGGFDIVKSVIGRGKARKEEKEGLQERGLEELAEKEKTDPTINYKRGGKIDSILPYLSDRFKAGGYINKYEDGDIIKGNMPEVKVTPEMQSKRDFPTELVESGEEYKNAPWYKQMFMMNPNVRYGLPPLPFSGKTAMIRHLKDITKFTSKNWKKLASLKAGQLGAIGAMSQYGTDNPYTAPEGSFKPYLTKWGAGGRTFGPSHENGGIPMNVSSTGEQVELEGGEGVFDKGAMKKLDKYKKTGNVESAGKLVFAEMDSWKSAGTAKYGTKIKEY